MARDGFDVNRWPSMLSYFFYKKCAKLTLAKNVVLLFLQKIHEGVY